MFEERRQAFEWQYWSSKFIFWLVIALVSLGATFSALHFVHSLNQPSDVEFEGSIKGVKLKTSLVGIVILVISLLLFYLYLSNVYPISEVH